MADKEKTPLPQNKEQPVAAEAAEPPAEVKKKWWQRIFKSKEEHEAESGHKPSLEQKIKEGGKKIIDGIKDGGEKMADGFNKQVVKPTEHVLEDTSKLAGRISVLPLRLAGSVAAGLADGVKEETDKDPVVKEHVKNAAGVSQQILNMALNAVGAGINKTLSTKDANAAAKIEGQVKADVSVAPIMPQPTNVPAGTNPTTGLPMPNANNGGVPQTASGQRNPLR